MTAIQKIKIEFFVPEGTTIPDTVEEWDESKWPRICDDLENELEEKAYSLAAKYGLTVTLD